MGYGDEIMASAEARALKRANPDARIVVGDGTRERWSVIFEGNPHLSRLADVRDGERVVWLRNYRGRRPYLDYGVADAEVRQVFKPYRAVPGDIVLSPTERADADALLRAPAIGKPLVSIEPNVDFGPNKDWGFARWQAVADRLRDRVMLVQPSYGKQLLAGARPIRTTFRTYCAVLLRCDLHVGPEGGLHHAAAALGRPAVVVFGGRIHPDLTGYAGHENLYVDAPGSPCGMVAPCDHCRRCFDAIRVDEVVSGVWRRLAAGARARSTPAPSREHGSRARSREDDTVQSSHK